MPRGDVEAPLTAAERLVGGAATSQRASLLRECLIPGMR